jgi:tRNA threonylcarbamoyladenosine biosynthesis protein TsaB
MLLALDTATETCAVALVRGHEVIERAEHVGQGHSDRLIPMVQAVLAEAGVGPAALDAVAFGAGPGSFTGLRIACGVAQGIAYAIDRPVVAVGNLEALALNAASGMPDARRIAVAIDARMRECYWAVYQIEGISGPKAVVGANTTARSPATVAAMPDFRISELVPPSLSSAEALADTLMGWSPDTLAGEAFDVFAPHLDRVAAARRQPRAVASAAAIARLGVERLQAGCAVMPARAMPIYVRDRVAQTTEERLAQRAARAA